MRIDKELEKNDYTKFPTWNPCFKSVAIAHQLELFKGSPVKYNSTSMGYFFELITKCLFGGELCSHLNLNRVREPGEEDDEENTTAIHPDITGNGSTWESKACRAGHHVLLYDFQVAKYADMQLSNLKEKIYYAIYRHSFKQISKYSKDKFSLFKELSTSTYYLLIMPLSMIFYLHQLPVLKTDYGFAMVNNSWVRRYDGEKWYTCSQLKSTALNAIFFNKGNAFKNMDINAKNYSYKYYMCPEIAIADNLIKPFPILFIDDKNHDHWVKGFESGFVQSNILEASRVARKENEKTPF